MRDIALFVRGRPRAKDFYFPLVVRAWVRVALRSVVVRLACSAVRCVAVPVGWGCVGGCLGGRVDGGRPEGRCPRTLRQREEIQQDDGGWVRQ